MNPLITPAELMERVAGPVPPLLLDVRWNLTGPPGEPEYRAGHLPGARWVDLETELSGPKAADGSGGRHPLPSAETFGAALRRVGVSATRPVVAYDAGSGLSAARLWWLLTDAGHGDVRVLDGGYAGWVAAGGAVATGPDDGEATGPDDGEWIVPDEGEGTVADEGEGTGAVAEPGDFVPAPGSRAVVTGDELAALITVAGHAPVLDVRPAARYAATEDPMDPVAGHVPGAVSAPSMDNLVTGPDGVARFRPPAEIAARYAPHADPILYCGSGITAAHSLLALESAGLAGRIYPGSWSDWISDPTRPVATGPDPSGPGITTR